MPDIPENQVNREEEWMAYLGGAGDVPQGAPYNRMEEWFLYMGGDGDEPNGGPLNRLEEWYAWMAENGGGGGAPATEQAVAFDLAAFFEEYTPTATAVEYTE